MARNRMLNPEFWLDEELAKLSAHARLLYQGLWGICDDNYATLPNRPEWIKAQVFPYESVDIHLLLHELSESSRILLFCSENKEYWFLKNFFKHQKVDKPSKPKYPKFEANLMRLPEDSTSTPAEVKISKVKKRKNYKKENVDDEIKVFKTIRPDKPVSLEEKISGRKKAREKPPDDRKDSENAAITVSLEEILRTFNETYKTAYRNSDLIRNNVAYWLEKYSLEEIKEAIKISKNPHWWNDQERIGVEFLFRQKNKSGNCDYIGECLNEKNKDDDKGVIRLSPGMSWHPEYA